MAQDDVPPPPRKWAHAGRALFISLPVLAALAALGLVREMEARADIARGTAALLMGDGETALARLRPRASREATAGPLGLAEALTGGGGRLVGTGEHLLPVAVDGALRRGDHDGVLRLGALRPGDPRVALHVAAALLEEGRDSEAQKAAADVPPALRTGGMGLDIERGLALRGRGARTLVRDREGVLVGWIDAAGLGHPLTPADELLFPPRAAAEAGGTPGAGLRLTVDRRLSRLGEEALGTHRGTIVLLDPRNGQVLAAVSDARTRAEGGTAAFEERREPASISKIITAAAALRAGIDPDAEIARMTCLGHARYGSGSLWCAAPGGPLRGLGHALAMSCNVAFANLGERLGREKIVNELRLWGFDAANHDLPGAGRITAPEGDARQLADLSVGLSATDITPVHGALLGAVIANEGRMPIPTFLAAEDGVLGLTPRRLPVRAARPVLDPAWVPVLTRAMVAVTDPGGTAELADPPGFPVAMKTGTAAEGALGYHVNYIGAGPLPDPRLAFCVRITHQPSSRRVNEVAREVLRALLLSLAS